MADGGTNDRDSQDRDAEVRATLDDYLALRGAIEDGDATWTDLARFFTDDAVYIDPAWGRQEQRTSGTTSQVFRPTKITPAMQFSVTSRPNVGTQDLGLIVEGFFMNLPKGKGTEVLEREPVLLPSGIEGYRVVYTDMSRRIPLKSEILFVLAGGRFYFLSVQSTPVWFDRHRPALERLLYSLTLPS